MSARPHADGVAPRDSAGLLSSASSFFLPVGRHFEPGAIAGYYIDMRVKAHAPDAPETGGAPHTLYVKAIQRGLGCFERYVAGEGERWLTAAKECADELLGHQEWEGPLAGAFLHLTAFPHTFPLRAPWVSGMAQGEAASLFVRVFTQTADDRYADAAINALRPLSVSSRDGGACALLDGRPLPEEYPTQPPSFVLNGAIFALWGHLDVAVALGDAAAQAAFDTGLDTLSTNLRRWDLGHWSRYDLFPHPLVNVASSFYHDLHVNQLRAMHRLAPRVELAETADRWAGYRDSARCRRLAFARKVLFRLATPRNSVFARRLPWSRLRGA